MLWTSRGQKSDIYQLQLAIPGFGFGSSTSYRRTSFSQSEVLITMITFSASVVALLVTKTSDISAYLRDRIRRYRSANLMRPLARAEP